MRLAEIEKHVKGGTRRARETLDAAAQRVAFIVNAVNAVFDDGTLDQAIDDTNIILADAAHITSRAGGHRHHDGGGAGGPPQPHQDDPPSDPGDPAQPVAPEDPQTPSGHQPPQEPPPPIPPPAPPAE